MKLFVKLSEGMTLLFIQLRRPYLGEFKHMRPVHRTSSGDKELNGKSKNKSIADI